MIEVQLQLRSIDQMLTVHLYAYAIYREVVKMPS